MIDSTDYDAHLSVWNDLLTTAMVGTARKPVAPPAPGTAPGDVLAHAGAAEPEQVLLGMAATLTLYRRAGWLAPVDHSPAPEPCPPDRLPCCTPRAGEHLARMLDKTYREVLPEWLAAVAATGQRVPTEYLQDLLELGHKQAGLRPSILPVLGRRGHWLAARNPGWHYAAIPELAEHAVMQAGDLQSLWETTAGAARLELLRQLRACDPACARDLVGATWPTEKAADRAAFLATFDTQLSMDDEPFLEQVLGDRSKDVRTTAADLLARLPESRLVQRMIARVQPLLEWTPGQPGRMGVLPGKKPALTVSRLPDTCDAEMLRDGIEPKPPRQHATGEKAWWLTQMIGSIPPSFWSRTWQATPAELLAASMTSRDWRALFFEGWTLAAMRQRDSDWIEALLLARQGKAHSSEALHEALPLLPAERRDALIVNVFAAHPEPLHMGHPAFWMLYTGWHTWSATLTRLVLDSLRRRVAMEAAGAAVDHQVRRQVPQFGLRMLPDLADEAATGWAMDAPGWGFWSGAIEEMLAVLTFRHTMLKEFHR